MRLHLHCHVASSLDRILQENKLEIDFLYQIVRRHVSESISDTKWPAMLPTRVGNRCCLAYLEEMARHLAHYFVPRITSILNDFVPTNPSWFSSCQVHGAPRPFKVNRS